MFYSDHTLRKSLNNFQLVKEKENQPKKRGHLLKSYLKYENKELLIQIKSILLLVEFQYNSY